LAVRLLDTIDPERAPGIVDVYELLPVAGHPLGLRVRGARRRDQHDPEQHGGPRQPADALRHPTPMHDRLPA
jgi:hypothetical protein